jgi:hypothetical protein
VVFVQNVQSGCTKGGCPSVCLLTCSILQSIEWIFIKFVIEKSTLKLVSEN